MLIIKSYPQTSFEVFKLNKNLGYMDFCESFKSILVLYTELNLLEYKEMLKR